MIEYFMDFYYKGIKTNYLISTTGKVFSLYTNKFLEPSTSTDGRLSVCLRINNKDISLKIHRMVASTFLGTIENTTVNHINENKLDNRVENLEIIPLNTNIKYYQNNHPDWSNKKYSDELIHKICRDLKSGIHYREVAHKYNLPIEYVYDIVRGRTRKKISNLYRPFPIESRQRDGRRQNKILKENILKLIRENRSNKEIYNILDLSSNYSTDKLISRIRKKVNIPDPKFIDQELKSVLIHLIKSGKSNRQIRSIAGFESIDSDLLARLRKKLNLPDFNENGVPLNIQNEIMVLIEQGLSNSDISKIYGLERNTYSINLFGRLRQKVKKKSSTTIENSLGVSRVHS